MTTPLAIFDAKQLARATSSICLPLIGKSLQYWDDFAERTREIQDFDTCSVIEIYDDGHTIRWGLDLYNDFQKTCIKAIVAALVETSDITSVCSWILNFKRVIFRFGRGLIEQLCIVEPFNIKQSWESFIFPMLKLREEGNALKKLLQFFCAYRLGAWAPEFSSLISGLSVPWTDPFRRVRSGECFIPVEHVHLIYEYLDDLSAQAALGDAEIEDCRICTALILADQHAFRPSTISRIKIEDVRIHDNGSVHISAIMVKKHDGSQRIRVTRRVKREWCSILRSFFDNRGLVVGRKSRALNRFLGWTPSEVSTAIGNRLELLCGERWTATDLRHTAAQRMVDAGASADQLAEFLGHNSMLVGNVYFAQSASQAARVNDALAISPIYSRIPEIHRTRTIDKAALLAAPEENQIGAAPHGIAIAGIGTCGLGQSLCEKNPVLSCYGCRKFLAVNEAAIHEDVVSSLRPIVLQFEAAGRGHTISPAYTQLQRTLTNAMGVASAIRSGGIAKR